MAERKRPSSDPKPNDANKQPPNKRPTAPHPFSAFEIGRERQEREEQGQLDYFNQLMRQKDQEREQAFDQRVKELQEQQRPNLYEQLLKQGTERRKQNEHNFGNLVKEMTSMNKVAATSMFPESALLNSRIDPLEQSTTRVHQSPSAEILDDPPAYSYDSDDDDNSDVIPIDGYDFDGTQPRPSKMSVSEKIMCVLLHQARFNTTNREVEHMVNLFNCMAGEEEIPWTDWDTLIKKIPNKFIPTIYKYFYTSCEACEKLYGPTTETNANNMDTCIHGQEITGYFIYIKLADWLRHIITIRYDEIMKRLPRRSNRFIHDLPDTLHYRTLTKPADDGVPILTLTLGWDGAAFTNDNSRSMWPLVAYLNELSYQDRITNPMLIALDSNPNPPKDDIMFRPLVDELADLECNPLKVLINGEDKMFYVKLLLIIADAPARAKILNFNNYNGIYGKINLNFFRD